MNETLGTVTPNAQVPNYSNQPRNMRLASRGASNVPTTRIFPPVKGGTCDYCGTLDPNQPGDYQYKLCPHYRGMDLRCIYCPLQKDQDEVVRNSTLMVFEHPYRAGELLVKCNSFDCNKSFETEFNIKR